MLKPKPTLVKKSQGLYSQLREIRESGQGIVNYYFETETSFKDYKGDPKNVPVLTEEVFKKWSIQQPINPQIFFTDKGRNESLEKVAEIFKDTMHDLGAKYFTV